MWLLDIVRSYLIISTWNMFDFTIFLGQQLYSMMGKVGGGTVVLNSPYSGIFFFFWWTYEALSILFTCNWSNWKYGNLKHHHSGRHRILGKLAGSFSWREGIFFYFNKAFKTEKILKYSIREQINVKYRCSGWFQVQGIILKVFVLQLTCK